MVCQDILLSTRGPPTSFSLPTLLVPNFIGPLPKVMEVGDKFLEISSLDGNLGTVLQLLELLNLLLRWKSPETSRVFNSLIFKLNLQEHLSSCMYQKFHCNRCKQFVILNEHEDYCPEMPVPCSLCSEVMKRKRLKVSIVFSHILFILFPVKSSCLNLFVSNFWFFQKKYVLTKEKTYLLKWKLNSWGRCFWESQILSPALAKVFLFLNSSLPFSQTVIICGKIFHLCYGCCFDLS